MNILGISGSLRQKSFNTALLAAAEKMIPAGSSLTLQTLHGIPLYNAEEEEASGFPPAVLALQKAIYEADALLIATPEYNNSIPGVLKNAIDWVSRPSALYSSIFTGKKVALIGASPGGFGTILSQNAWLPVLRYFGADVWFGGRLLVSRAAEVFDENGALLDTRIEKTLQKFLTDFIARCERN